MRLTGRSRNRKTSNGEHGGSVLFRGRSVLATHTPPRGSGAADVKAGRRTVPVGRCFFWLPGALFERGSGTADVKAGRRTVPVRRRFFWLPGALFE